MLFIETTVFTKELPGYFADEEYRQLQEFLIERPEAGAIIPGTNGLRKLRWSLNKQGKRGGVRVIYYWQLAADQIYLLTLYAKNEMSDLSPKEKKVLRQMVAGWKNG